MTQDTKEIILEIAKGAGLISLALLLPGACEAIKHFKKLDKIDRKRKYYINITIKKLISQKMLIEDSRGFLKLSETGEKYLIEIGDRDNVILKPKRWDGKYRVIIFDIPEEKKKIRNVIRRQLMTWGFLRLQNSVWVHPYECQNIVTLLKTKFYVGGEVLYLTVDSIENDAWIRNQFSLL